MGKIRTGARTFLFAVQQACHLSHIAGFRTGLTTILGEPRAQQVYELWSPFCVLVESIIAADDHFNQIDATQPDVEGVTGTDEDTDLASTPA